MPSDCVRGYTAEDITTLPRRRSKPKFSRTLLCADDRAIGMSELSESSRRLRSMMALVIKTTTSTVVHMWCACVLFFKYSAAVGHYARVSVSSLKMKEARNSLMREVAV